MISWPELNHLNAFVKNCYKRIDAIYQKLEKCSDKNVLQSAGITHKRHSSTGTFLRSFHFKKRFMTI